MITLCMRWEREASDCAEAAPTLTKRAEQKKTCRPARRIVSSSTRGLLFVREEGAAIFLQKPPFFQGRGRRRVEGKASWREVSGPTVRWGAAARVDVWQGSWGNPFHFLQSISLRSCRFGFPRGSCAFRRGSAW